MILEEAGFRQPFARDLQRRYLWVGYSTNSRHADGLDAIPLSSLGATVYSASFSEPSKEIPIDLAALTKGGRGGLQSKAGTEPDMLNPRPAAVRQVGSVYRVVQK